MPALRCETSICQPVVQDTTQAQELEADTGKRLSRTGRLPHPERLPRIITPALPSACDNRASRGPRDLQTTVRPSITPPPDACTLPAHLWLPAEGTMVHRWRPPVSPTRFQLCGSPFPR